MKLNTIYRGDCKDILTRTFSQVDRYFTTHGVGSDLPEEFADLIYMDPPFCSNRYYEQNLYGKDDNKIGFDDNQWGYGEDGLKGVYLPYMKKRIQRCYDVLKKTGSFYLHCDWHASHYLKCMCDDIFKSMKLFRNEVIWNYPQSIKSSKHKFLSNHDVLLFYTKSNGYTFNPQINEYTEKQLNRFKHEDEQGKFYYDTRRDSENNKIRVKVYLKKEGTPVGSVWYYARAQGNERLGYPTQKPEALLERIIKASSNPGEIVLDPFCGCGTTIATAYKLGRTFVGIDIREKACKVIIKRLKDIGAKDIELNLGMYTVEQLKTLSPMAFQDYIIEICLQGHSNIKKTNDEGIDGYVKDIPVQVKQNKISRGIVDGFETAVIRYYGKLGNVEGIKRGIIICDGTPGDGVWNEISEAEKRNINIEIITIQNCCDILNKRLYDIEEQLNKEDNEANHV